MKTSILLDAQYFPCVDYFALILKYDDVIIESQENYQKQTARNRCYIQGANHIERLSVPVARPSGQKIKTTEILISPDAKWKNEHWRAIQTAYANAPFFEFYAQSIKDELFQNHEKLFDLNMNLLQLILKLLNISKSICYTEKYQSYLSENISDFRNQVCSKKPFFKHYVPYFQVFGKQFSPNLSILDLLFCQGNQAVQYLKNELK